MTLEDKGFLDCLHVIEIIIWIKMSTKMMPNRNLFESESLSDSDVEPELSDVVTCTKTVILSSRIFHLVSIILYICQIGFYLNFYSFFNLEVSYALRYLLSHGSYIRWERSDTSLPLNGHL